MATEEENQRAADVTNQISDWDRSTINKQLKLSNQIYDRSDKQNKAFAERQKIQNNQKADTDRFQAQRSLANSARSLYNTSGNALNGSTTGNIALMLNGQQDDDNVDYWSTLRQNNNAVENAYQESLNSNTLGRMQAASDAEIAKRNIESNQAASLYNISDDVYLSPATHAKYDWKSAYGTTIGSKNNASTGISNAKKKATANEISLGGYDPRGGYMQSSQPSNGTDYYSKIVRRGI